MKPFNRRGKRSENDKLARDTAHKKGMIYYTGDVCLTCGNTTRNVKSFRCVHCINTLRAKNHKKTKDQLQQRKSTGFIGEPIDIWRNAVLSKSWKEPICIPFPN